jgi:hypothetical protein
MEAAAVCDACKEVQNIECLDLTKLCISECEREDTPRSPVCDALSAPAVNGIDDWYSHEIEIEIVRLEKEGQALASSHGALHSSLLQSQPVPVTKFE